MAPETFLSPAREWRGLLAQAAGLVPGIAPVAPAAHVRDGIDEAAIDELGHRRRDARAHPAAATAMRYRAEGGAEGLHLAVDVGLGNVIHVY